MGRPRLPWIKVWLDCQSNPKMKRLTLAEFGVWIKLMLLAGQCGKDGKLMISESVPMTISDIISSISNQIDNKKSRNSVNSCIAKLLEFGSLVWDDKVLIIKNYVSRQSYYPSDIKVGINSELIPNKLRVIEQRENRTEQRRTEEKEILKKKYGQFQNVLLSEEEYEKLKTKFPDFQERIERLSTGIASKGYKYKSHYATILNWANKDEKEKKLQPQQHKPGQRVPEKYMTPEEFLAKT